MDILSRKCEKCRRPSGKYTPFTHWDQFTDLSYRLLVTTFCAAVFLAGVKCVLYSCERGWFAEEVFDLIGGCTRQDRQLFGASVGGDSGVSGFLLPHVVTYGGTDAGVTLGLSHTTFCCQTLLLMSGSVERNPGPGPTRQTRLGSVSRTGGEEKRLSLDPTSSSAADVTTATTGKQPTLIDVMTKLGAMTDLMDTKFDEVKKEVNDLRQDYAALQSEVKEMRTEVGELRQENDDLRKTNQALIARLESMERKTDDLECRSKRNNLIFYGMHKSPGETSADCEGMVKDLLTDKLELSDDIEFDRVHRLNSKPDSPVIARCVFYKQKLAILKGKRKLQGTSVFVGEDFSSRVRDIRRKLTPHLKTARKDGKQATMVFDHLIIDGKKFALSDGDALIEIK